MGPKFRKKVKEHVRCPREKLREKYGTERPRRSTNIPSSIRKDFRKEKEKKEREERTNYWRYRIFRKCDFTRTRIEIRFSFFFFILFYSNIAYPRYIRSLAALLDRYLRWKSAHCPALL